MTIVFQKSMLKSKAAKRIVADAKLTYFKEKVLEHLDRLERKEKKKEQAVQKALIEAECLRKAAYPVGTIREWKGKKYVKTAPGKWRRKYDSDSRGAKQSIAAIKRKVDECESVEELLEVAKQNKHRFTDENGRYLPFVKEMFDYVGKKHKEIKGAKNAGQSAGDGKPKAGGSSGGDDGGGGDNKGVEFSKQSNERKAKLAVKINKTIVAEIEADTVPYNGDGKFVSAARKWLESNPQGSAKTLIGDVDIAWGAIKADMNHNVSDGYMKLQTLPAIKDVLEKGAYLGYEKDFDGKPIDNHYFAGKINYGGKEQIVFCRVRKNAGKNNRFYVHEVFTEKEIRDGANGKTGSQFSSLRGKDLYQFILHDIFNAGDGIKKEDSKREPGPHLGRLTGNPPNTESRYDSNVSQTGGAVKQKKKDILGNVSEDSLKKKGISGNAARLIMSVYGAVEDAPLQDTPEARRAYAKGLNALRDKLEGAKTDADVEDALRDIGDDLSLFSYKMKLRSTEEYKKRRAAWENAEQKSSESFNRLQELTRKKDKESRAAERRVYKQVKEYLVENGAMYEFEGLKDEYDRERYAERLPSGKKGEYDKFFDRIYKKEEARLNEKLAKLNAEVKAENAAYKEAKEKASNARADFEKWEDGQTRAMANADPLYEGWVQLGKGFREAVERERANLIPGF